MADPSAASSGTSAKTFALQKGAVLVKRYRIEEQIASSSYSHVYRAVDIKAEKENKRDTAVCVKIEREIQAPRRSILKFECEALRIFRKTNLVPRVIAFSEYEKGAQGALLVSDLMGPDLRRLLKRNGRLSGQAAGYLGIQILQILRKMHEKGLVHSDVKPANFVIGRGKEDGLKVYGIDFGLAIRHLDEHGEPRSRREDQQFRGTSMYASEAAHACKALGRVDDLWSLAYSLLELVTGSLPWYGLLARADRMPPEQKKKAKHGTHCLKHLLTKVAMRRHIDLENPKSIKESRSLEKYLEEHVPRPLIRLLRHLTKLRYETEPAYDHIKGLLQQLGTPEELKAAAKRELGSEFVPERPTRLRAGTKLPEDDLNPAEGDAAEAAAAAEMATSQGDHRTVDPTPAVGSRATVPQPQTALSCYADMIGRWSYPGGMYEIFEADGRLFYQEALGALFVLGELFPKVSNPDCLAARLEKVSDGSRELQGKVIVRKCGATLCSNIFPVWSTEWGPNTVAQRFEAPLLPMATMQSPLGTPPYGGPAPSPLGSPGDINGNGDISYNGGATESYGEAPAKDDMFPTDGQRAHHAQNCDGIMEWANGNTIAVTEDFAAEEDEELSFTDPSPPRHNPGDPAADISQVSTTPAMSSQVPQYSPAAWAQAAAEVQTALKRPGPLEASQGASKRLKVSDAVVHQDGGQHRPRHLQMHGAERQVLQAQGQIEPDLGMQGESVEAL